MSTDFDRPVAYESGAETRGISHAAGVVGFFTLLSRILGLVRDMVLANLFGTGMVADAFFVAFRIPNLLRRLFAEGSLTIAFIPVFTEYLRTRSRGEAFDLARVVLALLTVILTLVTVIGILFSPWIVRVQAFGFGGAGAKYELTVLLTRITFPYIFFVGIVAFFMGVLNSLRRFGAPAASPIFLNVGIIAGAYAVSPLLSEPIVGVAVGVLIGGFLQVVLQLPWVVREGLRLFPRWQPGHPAVKRIGLLMLPAVVGSAVYQFNQFLGTLLASFLPEGSVSWLYYADRLVQFPLGIFAIAISTAALPSLATQAADRDMGQFTTTLSHAMRLVFFITFPAMVGLIVVGEPLVRILFERGEFDAGSTRMTYLALLFYTVGLWAFSGIRVMVSAFYALQDTRTPVKVAVVALVSNGVLGLALMGPLRHGGLALALSAASSIQFALLVLFMRRRVPYGFVGPVALSAMKCTIAALAMGVVVFLVHSRWLPVDPTSGLLRMTLDLLALVGIGVLAYLAAAGLLRCRELRSVVDMVRPIDRGER